MLTRNQASFVSVLLVTLSSLASGCSDSGPSTQLVVLMDTDYSVPAEVDRIRARVLKISEDGQEETETWSKVYPLSGDETNGSGLYALPATFGVLPANGDMERIIAIELEAIPPPRESTAEAGDEAPLVRSRVETGFVPEESRLLRMYLFRECAGVVCAQDETCGCVDAACSFLTCNPQFIEPQNLEPIENASQLPENPTIPSQGCPAPRTLCGNECVDTTSNPSFCGNCETVCESREVCSDGVCIDPADCRTESLTCSGFSYCDEDTGQCLRGCDVDAQCGSSETCDISIHECVCREEFALCGDICVDTETDPRFCGGCETACVSGEVCQASACIDLGNCVTNGIGCTGFTYCEQETGDCKAGCERNDQCGGANERCDVGSNTCVCDPGFERCPASTGTCVDQETDTEHCGGCGRTCPSEEICRDGECFDPNDCRSNGIGCSGFTYCDPATGDCEPGCDDNEQCPLPNERCNRSTNVCVCNAGFNRCGVQCFDLQNDDDNCGSCGTQCGDDICERGRCEDPDDCRRAANSCANDEYCDQSTGACRPGCDRDSQCPRANDSCDLSSNTCLCDSGFDDCGGACVNTTNDEDNCGSCGNACTGGNSRCCDGACVNPTNDEGNCGSCGNSCGGSEQCCGGGCTDITTETNCGGCGNSCGTGQLCCGGSCANTNTETNCGSCGNSCGAGQACCSGACTSTTSEPNCGGCGVTCAGSQECCNGACTSTTSEPNCGGCGVTCGGSQECCSGACTPTNTDANCGGCGVTCGAGQACCNGTSCTSTNTDANCGSCGNSCGTDEFCDSGTCTAIPVMSPPAPPAPPTPPDP